MNKRRLTRRQAWRVDKIQEDRLKRAVRKADLRPTDEGQLGPEQFGLVIANFGAMVELEDEAGTVRQCALRQNIGLPVTGDRVVWQPTPSGHGVVTAITPRQSLLARPDISGELRPLAANIDQILVVAAPLPRYDTQFIDPYLIAAEASGIHPLIVLNKADLTDDAIRLRLEADFAPYVQIGYRVIRASTRVLHGLDELVERLRGKTSVFVGQSGVGKSSLVKALLPGAAIVVGDLNEAALGRHTTSATRLYHLPCGGKIIDSPGVREFRLWDLGRERLAAGFPEFRPFLGQCRFRDCKHQDEPDCALAGAVRDGRISAARLASFRQLALEMEAQHLPAWAR